MKILVKKNLIIFRELYDWYDIRDRIKEDYGNKIFAISWRLKRELGFTVRQHKGLVKWDEDAAFQGQKDWLPDEFKNRYHYEDQIHLDFYNEAQLTMFILKYLG